MRKAFLLLLVIALSLDVVLPSAGANRNTAGRQKRGKTHVISAQAGATPVTWAWDPDGITINKGDTIRWENPTDTAHSVEAWEKGSGSGGWMSEQSLPPGGSATFRFTKGGIFLFRCPILGHSDILYLADEGNCVGMCGTVNVAY